MKAVNMKAVNMNIKKTLLAGALAKRKTYLISIVLIARAIGLEVNFTMFVNGITTLTLDALIVLLLRTLENGFVGTVVRKSTDIYKREGQNICFFICFQEL